MAQSFSYQMSLNHSFKKLEDMSITVFNVLGLLEISQREQMTETLQKLIHLSYCRLH